MSRSHAFKSRVEKSDQQLRQYIKGITVIVEEPIEIQPHLHHQLHHRADIQTHQLTTSDNQVHHVQVQQQSQPNQHHHHAQRQEIQIRRADLPIAHGNEVVQAQLQPQQMIITNGQLHNAQIINAGQIVTTSQGQQMIQTTGAQNVQSGQNVQLCQLVQTGNGTVQMIQQNGQPAQVVIQRTSDDRCEIIVQPDSQGDAQYYTEDGNIYPYYPCTHIHIHIINIIHIPNTYRSKNASLGNDAGHTPGRDTGRR